MADAAPLHALHELVASNNMEGVKEYLAKFNKAEQAEELNRLHDTKTALHLAARQPAPSLEMFELLLEHGANPSVTGDVCSLTKTIR